MYIREKMINKIGKINLLLSVVLFIIWTSVYFINVNNDIKLQNYEEVGKSQYLAKKIVPNFHDLSISFKFYINRLNEEPSTIKYENIFQTANYNDGIRLEYARLKGSESRWALVYTDNNKKLQGIDLGALPEKEQWHSFKVRYIDDNKQLIIYLNNEIIKSVSNVNAKFNFDNVVSGHGFNNNRIFDGMIYNFKIESSPIKSEDYNILYILSFILLLVILRNRILVTYSLVITNTKKYITKDNLHKYLIILVFIFIGLFYAIKYYNQIKLSDYTNINNQIKFEKALSIRGSTSIEFDFYIDPLKETVEGIQYENLFQTADWNNGFRVELARKTDFSTFWGLVYTKKSGQLMILQLGVPAEEKWNHFKMSYLKEKNRIDVFVNGINITSVDNANITPDFSKIIVGKAFENRIFHGKVKNFTIQKSFMPLYLYVVLSLISVLVFTLLIVKGIKEHHLVNDTFSKMTIFFKSLLVVSLLAFFSIFIFSAESYLVGENEIFRGIVALFSIIAFIVILSFAHHIQSNVVRRPLLTILYISFYSYIYLYFTSAMYMIGKFSDQVRRPYGLSIDEIAAIYQSSISESIQFIITSLGYLHLVIIVIVPLILTIVLFFSMKYINPMKNHKITFSYAIALIAAFYIILPSIPTYPKVIYAGFSKYSQQVDEMKEIAALRKKVDFNLSVNNEMKGTHILVIGESANKEHMGAYGYFRETTPWLSKQKENDNFIFFDNSYAPYCHTVPSILKIITEANQYNGQRQKQAISIIDIAKKAGFKTHWISEQYGTMIDTPLSVIINESDEVKYVEEGGYIINTLNNTMKNIDKTKNNLIILHLMGSHADYNQRIVGYKDRFTDAKREEIGNYSQEKHKKFMDNILNPYDSTIKYTDSLLEKIYNITARENSFVDSFIYFSDHGEDVFGKKFHNSANFSYPMVQIPLVMYFSDRYKQKYKDDFSLLNNRNKNIFTNDLLYNTMLDIFKIESDKFEDGYSLLDDNYKINESNALTMQKSPDEDTTYYTMTNTRYIKDDPVYIAKKNVEYLNKNYKNKFIAEHIDSNGKLHEMSYFGFCGMECNIDLEKFSIGHPPEYTTNIAIESHLSKLDPNNINKVWLDLKVQEGKGTKNSFDKFKILDQNKNIKSRVLIESTEEDLEIFTKDGWNTLFYLKPFNYSKCKILDEVCANDILKRIDKSGAKSISFPYTYYDFIKLKVEPKLSNDVKYHTFGLSKYDIFNNKFIDDINKLDITHDERIETILIPLNANFLY